MDAAGTVRDGGRHDGSPGGGDRRRDRGRRMAAGHALCGRDLRPGPSRRGTHLDEIHRRRSHRGGPGAGRAHGDARLSQVSRVRRGAAGVVTLALLLSVVLFHARVAYSTCGSSAASSVAASSAPVAPCQVAPAPPTVYDVLRARLGGDIARALTTQEQLSTALDQTAASEQVLSDQIYQEEARIADLEDQVALLDTQIQDTQDRIDVERAQVAAMA